MEFNMWKCDREDEEYKTATQKVEDFFDKIREEGKITAENHKLVYRKEQHRFARDVMSAIKENQILLVQAGVGIGKSMGYLIPVFHSINKVSNFDKVVISTSSIALQQQLLTDINFISKLLNIPIKAAIAKGINNYACIRNIEKISDLTKEETEVIKRLKKDISKKGTADRDELIKISDNIWKKVQINNRGACSNCSYSRNCLHNHNQKELTKANIIVTNHGNFIRNIIDDNSAITSSDMYIFDEAHNLESAIMGINESSLKLETIRKSLNYFINNNILLNYNDKNKIQSLIVKIDKFFANIRRRSSYHFRKNNTEERTIKITDCDKIAFNIKGLEENIQEIINDLQKIIIKIKNLKNIMNYNNSQYDHTLIQLNNCLNVFIDMLKKDDSTNIYWANYYKDNRINIGYVPKSNLSLSKSIFEKNIPIVCTSGTLLDANSTYNYFKQGLSLDKISSTSRTIVDGRIYNSPYNYKNNSLFYYDTDIANPKNYQEYLCQLVFKIRELIKITNGRCLILFTAKSTMTEVYNILSKEDFGFSLLMQGQMNNALLCQKFENEVKSCLFATGTFWEGIDIKGKSLCNVIITRLPFSNVDAITENKASEYSKKDAFKMIYLNEMVKKIAQGTGRLIRGKNDKGIICCLDSRFIKYKDIIASSTPYTNFTNNIEDVYKFSSQNITNRDKIKKKKKG